MLETVKDCHLYDNVLLGICLTECETGKVLDCNEHFARILGYESKDSIIGSYIVHREGRAKLLDTLLENGRIDNFETEIRRADGSYGAQRILCRLCPDKKVIKSIVIDVSKEKEALEELERKREDLEYANNVLTTVNEIGLRLILKPPSWGRIRELLATFGSMLSVQRAFLYEKRESASALFYRLFMEWSDGLPNLMDNANFKELCCSDFSDNVSLFRNVHEILERRRPFYGCIVEFPEVEGSLLDSVGIQSIAVVPIIVMNGEEHNWGIVGFGSTNNRFWSETEIQSLFSVATLIALMIGRVKEAEKREYIVSTLQQQVFAIKNEQERELQLLRSMNTKSIVNGGYSAG